MYCVNCGVHLADTQDRCPLCNTACCHPDFPRPQITPLYPAGQPQPQINPAGAMGAVTLLYCIPILIILLCDLRINRAVTWSGYAIGSLLLVYEFFLLPGWFRRPNPVIFVPCAFAAAAIFLMYISAATGSHWFFPFALPLVAGLCLIATALVTLLRYLHHGKLFIFGGATVAMGLYAPLVELLVIRSFHRPVTGWSVYPFVALVVLGVFLIFLGICPSARYTMERKFFI